MRINERAQKVRGEREVMSRQIQAADENGVIRPLEPVQLAEGGEERKTALIERKEVINAGHFDVLWSHRFDVLL